LIGEGRNGGSTINREDGAQAAGQSRGRRGELFIGPPRIDFEIGVGDGAVTGARADVQGGGSKQGSGARRQRDRDIKRSWDAGGRVVVELILGFDDRLGAEDGAGVGAPGLGREIEFGGGAQDFRERTEIAAASSTRVRGGGDSIDRGGSAAARWAEDLAVWRDGIAGGRSDLDGSSIADCDCVRAGSARDSQGNGEGGRIADGDGNAGDIPSCPGDVRGDGGVEFKARRRFKDQSDTRAGCNVHLVTFGDGDGAERCPGGSRSVSGLVGRDRSAPCGGGDGYVSENAGRVE